MKRMSILIIALLIVSLPVQSWALSMEAAINSAFDATNGRLRLKIEAYDSTANNVSYSMEQIVADNLYDSTTKAITVSLTGTLAFTGDQTMTGDLTVTGDTDLTGALDVTGDSGLDGAVTINDSGADKDTVIEGDTDTSLVVVDASTDRVGISVAAPAATLDVDGSAVFNDSGADADFRVESDTQTHAIFVDASANSVGIRNSAPSASFALDVVGSITATGQIRIGSRVATEIDTVAADDVTPDVSGGNFFVTSANTGATAITDLDNPVAGQIVVIVCGSTTNASTIADSGNFTLSAAWSPDSVGDSITLLVYADNTYYELARADN